MIQTTRHSVLRFCHRFYGGEDAVKTSEYKMVGEYMIKILLEEHPEAATLGSGVYYVDSVDLEFVIRSGKITTVQPSNRVTKRE